MTSTTTDTQPLTIEDLDRTLADERHLGWGYAISLDLAPSRRGQLDRVVVSVANHLGLDYETLFVWSNSKNGRWLVDDASGTEPTRALVLRYLNARWVAQDYTDLCATARSYGIPTSLDDPATPQTVAALREAVAKAEARVVILVRLSNGDTAEAETPEEAIFAARTIWDEATEGSYYAGHGLTTAFYVDDLLVRDNVRRSELTTGAI